jgi:hypothetical protein
MGHFEEIHSFNLANNDTYDAGLYSFVRYNEKEKLIIVNNFNQKTLAVVNLKLPKDLLAKWQIRDGAYKVEEQLFKQIKTTLNVSGGEGKMTVALAPYESLILKMP